jgi:arylsulfatase A-like enzyme
MPAGAMGLAALAFLFSTAGPSAASPGDEGSVLVVLADDLGIDALPFYRLDPAVRANLTPNLADLAARGVRFENAWGAPKCSPARAALHTGEASFRTGIGNVIEAGAHSLSPAALTLPEALALAPAPYTAGFFGKWHLERTGSSQVCAPSALHGYDAFAGTLFQVPPEPGYCDWRERTCGGSAGASTRVFDYMPGWIFDEAEAWIRAQPGPWLCTLAPQLPYDLMHTPPADLQNVRSAPECSACASGNRACFDAALRAFDTKLGHVLAALGPDWETRVTVIFTADNGTPNSVNRYWPAGRAKLTLFEGGVRVPFVVAGRAVAPGRRGSVSGALVAVSDVFRTVIGQAGVDALPPGTARDSYDLAPLLADPPQPNGRTHLLAESFGRNLPAPPYPVHKVAVRDARYKLVYDWTNRRPLHLFDLARDPRELVNLVPPPANSPAAQALAALVARIQVLLGS